VLPKRIIHVVQNQRHKLQEPPAVPERACSSTYYKSRKSAYVPDLYVDKAGMYVRKKLKQGRFCARSEGIWPGLLIRPEEQR